MNQAKAKILDSILLKFEGNKSITWKSLQDGLFDDIENYDIIENNINFLIGDGMLKREPHTESLYLTDKGFATMTDLKNLGYYLKQKKEKRESTLKNIIALLTIITFLLVCYRFTNDFIIKNKETYPTKTDSLSNPSQITKSSKFIDTIVAVDSNKKNKIGTN